MSKKPNRGAKPIPAMDFAYEEYQKLSAVTPHSKSYHVAAALKMFRELPDAERDRLAAEYARELAEKGK